MYMARGLSYRKHKESVKIKKRLKIVKSWGISEVVGEPSMYEKEPHRMHKYNLNCGCKQCHFYKNVGNSKKRMSHRDKKIYGT